MILQVVLLTVLGFVIPGAATMAIVHAGFNRDWPIPVLAALFLLTFVMMMLSIYWCLVVLQ